MVAVDYPAGSAWTRRIRGKLAIAGIPEAASLFGLIGCGVIWVITWSLGCLLTWLLLITQQAPHGRAESAGNSRLQGSLRLPASFAERLRSDLGNHVTAWLLAVLLWAAWLLAVLLVAVLRLAVLRLAAAPARRRPLVEAREAVEWARTPMHPRRCRDSGLPPSGDLPTPVLRSCSRPAWRTAGRLSRGDHHRRRCR
jgi:hypothetical protein